MLWFGRMFALFSEDAESVSLVSLCRDRRPPGGGGRPPLGGGDPPNPFSAGGSFDEDDEDPEALNTGT